MIKSLLLRSSIILILAAVMLGACAPKVAQVEQTVPTSTPENVAVSQGEMTTIKVGYIPIAAYSPFFVALEKGYFAEEGIQVELQSFRTGAEMIAPLSLGQLDVGAGEIGTALFNAVKQGMDVRAVSSLGALAEGHPYLNLVARKDLMDSGAVTKVSDLAGKKIAVNSTRGVTEYLLNKALSVGDLTVDDVEMVVISFPDMIQALANKAIDAAILQYPIASKALNPGENGEPPIAGVLLAGDKIPDLPQATVVYYGKSLLDPAKHDLGVRFFKALIRAYRDLQGDGWRQDDQIVQAISKFTNTAAAAVQKSPVTYIDPNGLIHLGTMEDIQTYYLDRGYTDYKDPLSLDKVIDDSFRQDVIQQLGEYK